LIAVMVADEHGINNYLDRWSLDGNCESRGWKQQGH